MTIRKRYLHQQGGNGHHGINNGRLAETTRATERASSIDAEIRCIDLFCGAGGSSCGARLAGATPVAGIDRWDLGIQAYCLNNPLARVYQHTLEDLDPSAVAKEVGAVQLMLASPECTNHSVAKGNAKRDEKSRQTAFQVIRFAKVLQPRWLVIENVAKMRQWGDYEKWMRQLKRIGYKQPLEAVLDAQDYGVAQSRKRLFIICDREGEVSPPPKHCGRKVTVSSVLMPEDQQGRKWVFQPLNKKGRAEATLERAARAIEELGENDEFLMVYYGTDGAGGWQTLDRPLRTITTLDRFALVRPNCKGHEMRMLQPPELAAAMGFPVDYRWPNTARRNKIKMIGNAVCPPVMQAIVSHLIAK